MSEVKTSEIKGDEREERLQIVNGKEYYLKKGVWQILDAEDVVRSKYRVVAVVAVKQIRLNAIKVLLCGWRYDGFRGLWKTDLALLNTELWDVEKLKDAIDKFRAKYIHGVPPFPLK